MHSMENGDEHQPTSQHLLVLVLSVIGGNEIETEAAVCIMHHNRTNPISDLRSTVITSAVARPTRMRFPSVPVRSVTMRPRICMDVS